MPLSPPTPRRDIHRRVIDMTAHLREDGLYDVEARLTDAKPFPFRRFSASTDWPANEPLHDLSIRMTVDNDYVVRAIEASSDVTPFGVCKGAEGTLTVLLGERIARGWSARVKEALRGAASCTHLMEMLIPMGTTALQGIRALNAERVASLDEHGVPHKVDSCYAYGRDREVVMRLWPEHARPAAKTSG